MRHADHGAFQHAGLFVQHQLDFLGIDVVAARNDQILAPAHDADIAVGVDLAQIAGDEKPVVAQFGGGFLGHLPIALEHVRPAHLDHADLALRQGRAGVGVGDLQLDPRQRKAHGARAAFAVIGV